MRLASQVVDKIEAVLGENLVPPRFLNSSEAIQAAPLESPAKPLRGGVILKRAASPFFLIFRFLHFSPQVE
jgi:hypothetical protein